jgi:hemoglobin
MTANDIASLEDIKLLVNTFTLKFKQMISLVLFLKKIGNRWPEHLEKMYRFGKPSC